MIELAITLTTCILAGSIGRHIQGGAGRRIWAMLLYVILCLPSVYIYVTEGWLGIGTIVLLSGLVYLHFTMEQRFANLWLGLLRNCGAFVIVALVTGSLYPLLGLPIVFFSMKWAMEPNSAISDPHEIWEYILGAVTGYVWAIGPFTHNW